MKRELPEAHQQFVAGALLQIKGLTARQRGQLAPGRRDVSTYLAALLGDRGTGEKRDKIGNGRQFGPTVH